MNGEFEGTLPALESYFQHHWRTFQDTLGLSDAHANETLEHVCHDAWRLFELAQFLELFPEDIQDLPGSRHPNALRMAESISRRPAWSCLAGGV